MRTPHHRSLVARALAVITRTVVCAAVCAAVGCSATRHDEGVESLGQAATVCGRFDTVDIDGKAYEFQANEWNSSQTQCTDVNGTRFAVTQASFNLATNGPPATYPSIFKGCHWGNCTNGSGLPLQVAGIAPVVSSWSTSTPGGGAYDVAYDIWFNTTPTTNGQPNGAELMIWINHAGGVQPGGSQVETATISGATWNVWTAQVGWNLISYEAQAPVSSVNLDIRAFIQDAVARGSIKPAWYLIDVEAGFEIWQGGAGLTTNSFSVTVGGAGVDAGSGSNDAGSGSNDAGRRDGGASDGGNDGGSDAGGSALRAGLSLTSVWGSGYCANLTVTNGSPSAVSTWTAALNTNQSAIYNSWNATFAGKAPTYTVTPLSWNAAISPGSSQTVGFCANDLGNNWQPSVTSVSGQ